MALKILWKREHRNICLITCRRQNVLVQSACKVTVCLRIIRHQLLLSQTSARSSEGQRCRWAPEWGYGPKSSLKIKILVILCYFCSLRPTLCFQTKILWHLTNKMEALDPSERFHPVDLQSSQILGGGEW